MISLSGGFVYSTVDPNEKNIKWFDQVVTQLRRDWLPIVDPSRVVINKKYLFSQQSIDSIKATFKDEKFISSIRWEPLAFMDTIRNAIREEILRMPPTVGVRAVDPAAISLKKKDINMLKSRMVIQTDETMINQQVGLPPFKLDPSNFEGNIEEFDEMGLEETDTEDVNFFSKEFHRLWFEIGAEALLNNIMKLNRFDSESISRLVDDVLSVRACCFQSYVDQITGEIKQEYLAPDTVWGIFGDHVDGRDDICRGWQDTRTVGEWLKFVGEDFDFERDWFQLLAAVNYYPNPQKFTGFRRNGRPYSIAGDAERCAALGLNPNIHGEVDWNNIAHYKVYMGYVEFNSPEITGRWLRRHGNNNYAQRISCDYRIDERMQKEGYFTEEYYQQQWYKSFFLTTSSVTQYLYNFGKVYFQNITGANDEYSSGSMIVYRETGNSVMDNSKLLIDIGNFAFFKLAWAIYKAKPEEDVYFVEELVEVAKAIKSEFPQANIDSAMPAYQNALAQAIAFQQANTVRIRTYPRIDGRSIGNPAPLEGKRNGVDPISAAMQATIQWVEYMITSKNGINPMRLGANPPARESFRTEEMTLNASFNSTGYIYRMIQAVKERLATKALLTAQDIIRYKDSVPYKWVKTLIGDKSFNQLKVLEDIAAHRFGIYCININYQYERARIMEAADLALAKGSLTYDQWFIITQTEDYKKASMLLAHYNRKREKQMRKWAVEDQKAAAQLEAQLHQQKMEQLGLQGQIDIKVSENQAQAAIVGKQIEGQSRIAVKQMQVDSEPEKQQAKADSQKEILQEKSVIEQTKPFQTAFPAERLSGE